MAERLTETDLANIRLNCITAGRGGYVPIPYDHATLLIAAAEREARYAEALKQIEDYEADYAMQTDWNLNVLRDIARIAMEDKP